MQQPIILTEEQHAQGDLTALRSTQSIWEERDVYELQLKELFEIDNPSQKHRVDHAEQESAFIAERTTAPADHFRGTWVYFPWSGRLVHMLNKGDYDRLRTNRNRDLITQEEQAKLLTATIGIVGLSVGSNVAPALAYSGIGGTLKICEFDTLETSNMNRIRARVDQIGLTKLELCTQQLYEVNPFINIRDFPFALTRDVLSGFVEDSPAPQVIYEIIDSFEMKIHLRSLARKARIPVIMVTNLGDRVLMDVERYDLDPTIEYFNGRAGNIPQDMLDRPDLTDADKHRYAVDLAGVEHIPERAMESVRQIGKTLIGRPQLATTVTVAAGFSAYFAKKIILGDTTVSGSWLIDLDKLFTKDASL